MKKFRNGTHRVLHPQETLQKIRHSYSAFGVTRLAVVTGLDYLDIPVAVSVRPNSRNLSSHQGKGASLEAAKVSALMEAYEFACADRLRVEVTSCNAESAEMRWAISQFSRDPARFESNAVISCVYGHDIFTSNNVLLPIEMIALDFSNRASVKSAGFTAASYGVAAGNTRDEAKLHALCELIERDAVILWQIASSLSRERRRINPRHCSDPSVQRLLDRYAEAGMKVETWEITTELSVPAFLCVIDDAQARPPYLGRFGGSGCHPNEGVALCRALAEAAQSRLTYIVGTRDDISWASYATVGWYGSVASLVADLAPADVTSLPPPKGLSFDGDTIEEDLQAVLQRLAAAGMQQVLQVDLDLPEVGIPCVRMVVPDLEIMPGIATRRRRPRVLARLAE